MVNTNSKRRNQLTTDLLTPEAWLKRLESGRPKEDVTLIKQALEITYANVVEKGAEKDSRETKGNSKTMTAYQDALITAELLNELHMDSESIIASLVSDATHQKQISFETIEKQFGKRVADLVDGICKMHLINRFNQHVVVNRKENQSENLRRMLLAMANDVRVVLITLAARVVAMRSVKTKSESEKRAIAKETMDIYAPLANRLGIWQFKWELEDLSVRYLDTSTYKEIANLLDERRLDREEYIKSFVQTLSKRLKNSDINAEISGRPKHIYSIWRKMKRKNLSFNQIFDIRAVRVIVPSIAECYTVLGIVHSDYNYIRGEFDDYIASPKENMYQSLHTAVIGPEGKTIEIQIRTAHMHKHSELGVAAHWRYKEDVVEDASFERKIVWLRQLLEWKDDITSTEEFINELKDENIQDRIYVFTPDGKVIDLPNKSTPLDFAYRVHTEIGHRCRGAKANGKIIPLTKNLQSGQMIEILTLKQGGPSRDWLNPNLHYIHSSRAKAKIQAWFKQQNYDANVTEGRNIVERELQRLGISDISFEKIAQQFKYQKVDKFFAAVGRTDIKTTQIINAVQESTEKKEDKIHISRPRKRSKNEESDVYINGVGNLLTQIAKCCKPLPGDAIVGYITHGRGVTIHRQDCGNALHYNIDSKDRLVEVQWAERTESTYPVDILITAYDRSGLLRDITFVLANENINVIGVNTVSDKEQSKAYMTLTIEIRGLGQLSKVLSQVNQLPNIIDVKRQRQ